jgi:hypothetical protein
MRRKIMKNHENHENHGQSLTAFIANLRNDIGTWKYSCFAIPRHPFRRNQPIGQYIAKLFRKIADKIIKR